MAGGSQATGRTCNDYSGSLRCEVSPQGAGDTILYRYWLQLRKFLLSALLSQQWACQILMEQSKENAEIGRIFCRTGSIYL